MENRYTFGSTIPGTRSYHHFEPIMESTIGYKRTRDDTEFAGVHNFSGIPSSNINFKLYDYVACEYDSFWWIGMIEGISDSNVEVKVKFMLPHGLSPSFSWPSRDDICWVPSEKIICVLTPTTAATASGRKYSIAEKDLVYIEKHHN